MLKWLIPVAALTGLFFYSRRGGGSILGMSEDYPVNEAAPYGPSWGTERPPGLPPTARLASAPGEAYADVRTAARRQISDPAFVILLESIARSESGGTYARPSDRGRTPSKGFDARALEAADAPRYGTWVDGGRPNGKSMETAWGVFQFNRDAWRALPGVGPFAFPWEASAAEEVDRPVARYAQIWREVQLAGGDALASARGVRLWQASPLEHRNYVLRGRSNGFDSSWLLVDSTYRRRVNGHLAA